MKRLLPVRSPKLVGISCLIFLPICYILISTTTWTNYYSHLQLSSDYHKVTVISPHYRHSREFEFLINPGRNVCQADLLVLTIVLSAVSHFPSRQLIRSTWADPKWSDQLSIGVLFALGTSSNLTEMRAVRDESNQHGDIIMADFHDSYRNLTLKSVSILQWTNQHCPNVKFLLKADDDLMVNIFDLKSYLVKKLPSAKRFLFCYYWDGARVNRDPTTVLFVNRSEFADNFYPRYCAGPAYIISGDLIAPIYQSALKTKFLFIEDIFLTGIATVGLNVTFEMLPNSRNLYYGDWRLGHSDLIMVDRSIRHRRRMWDELKILHNISSTQPHLNNSSSNYDY